MSRILFDYECADCSTVFEELVYLDSPDSVNCPRCDGSSTKRLISAPRIDPKLGVDAESFPTMGDKWARKHRLKPKAE